MALETVTENTNQIFARNNAERKANPPLKALTLGEMANRARKAGWPPVLLVDREVFTTLIYLYQGFPALPPGCRDSGRIPIGLTDLMVAEFDNEDRIRMNEFVDPW